MPLWAGDGGVIGKISRFSTERRVGVHFVVAPVDISANHVKAICQQLRADCPAHAAGRAGYHGDFSHHCLPFLPDSG